MNVKYREQFPAKQDVKSATLLLPTASIHLIIVLHPSPSNPDDTSSLHPFALFSHRLTFLVIENICCHSKRCN